MDDYDVFLMMKNWQKYSKINLVDKISDYVRDELSDELADAVYVINKAESEDVAGFAWRKTTTFLEDAVWSELEDLAYEKIKDHINNISGEIDIGDKDFTCRICAIISIFQIA